MRNASDMWGLSPEARERPVRLEMDASVLYIDHDWGMLWLWDGTFGVYVANAKGAPAWVTPGARVRLEGELVPAEGFDLKRTPARLLGEPQSLPVHTLSGNLHRAQEFDVRRVTIDGLIESQVEADAGHLALNFVAEGRRFAMLCQVRPGDPLPQWRGSLARVTGLFLIEVNSADGVPNYRLLVNRPEDVEVTGWLARDPRFERPLVMIEDLPSIPAGETVRLVGTVQAHSPGVSVTLRDESGQARVLAPFAESMARGDRVEAIGRPVLVEGEWQLQEALYRALQQELAPVASLGLAQMRLAQQVLELGNAQAALGHPVKLAGRVTWSHPSASFFYLRDGTGSLRVERPDDVRPPALGRVFTVEGRTAAGDFAPQVVVTRAFEAGSVVDPPVRTITLEQALTGVEEGQCVELLGYLRHVQRGKPWARLELATPAGVFTAMVPDDDTLDGLAGAVVRVRGVCTALVNERRQLTGVCLWVAQRGDLFVEEAAPEDPFGAPARALSSLRQYGTLESSYRRVRVAGTVVHHVPGVSLFIQDAGEGLLVHARSSEQLQPGNLVEAVGLPGREGRRLVLREAVFRRKGVGEEPFPIDLEDPAGGAGPDGCLVRLSATLVDTIQHDRRTTLMLQTNRAVFEARLDATGPVDATRWLPGSTVTLTGVYTLTRDEAGQTEVFRLLLRSPEDVEVLTQPSWWTAQRALGAVALLGLSLMLGVAWVAALRKRVRSQTDQLRVQLAKEARLEARHRAIVENASDCILICDLDGRISTINPAGERLIGYDHEAVLRLNLRDLIAAEDLHAGVPLPDLAGMPEGTATFQCRFRTQDGRLVWVETSACLLREDGLPSGVLGIVRDISERKRVEAELERARDAAEASARSKSAFLANMSHEIRTPMNGVIGMSNLLLDTALSGEQRDFAETIRNSAEALLTVLNDILDFSKIEAGKLHFESLDFDLGETIDGVIELLASRALAKGLELAAYLPPGLPTLLRGDPGRVRQVLLNLIGNAVKFTEQGDVVVLVSLEKETGDRVRLRFEVKDTGIGLSAEAQARLFQPFEQADASTTRRYGGTGLGLAICKQIVELMGGAIGVRSRRVQGSVFWFTVELEKQPAGAVAPLLAAPDSLRGTKVLVVDDNPTNRCICERYVSAWGMIPELVPDAATALTALRDAVAAGAAFPLALLDYHMPEVDGVDLAAAVKRDPALGATQLLLLTSLDRRFEPGELAALGFSGLMTKPIRQSELQSAILRTVGMATGAAATPGPDLADQVPAKTLRVLLAEDNIVNQRVARLQLSKLGCTVDLAANGLEVLQALERAPYDLIFMDCQMPEMDGYEATRRIRAGHRQSGIRVVAMTANAMAGDREKCLAEGMDDYVSKPVRIDALKEAIERAALATSAGA